MKILMHHRHFPVSMGRYLKRALRKLGHEVFSVGSIDPRGPEYVIWSPGGYPQYVDAPALVTPEVPSYPLDEVLRSISFSPEAIIQMGDVTWLEGKAPVPNVIVMTDPHCVDYHPRLAHADLQICMQDHYRDLYPGSFWVPYAYDEEFHYFIPGEPREYDAVLIGLQYDNRVAVIERLRGMGHRVYRALGDLFHEGTRIYNRSLIAFNWSSRMDLPARFYEGLAYKRLVVTNRVPDLLRAGFQEGVHYVDFQSEDEAVEKCAFYIGHPELAQAIAERGYQAVQTKHTWRARAVQILTLMREQGLIAQP